MTPRLEVLDQPPVFWAFVRFLSEQIGYYDADAVKRGERITKDESVKRSPRSGFGSR